MNERALTKWESTTVTALEKLKAVTFQSVTPAVEHVILLLEEVKSWADWLVVLDLSLPVEIPSCR